MFHVAETFAGTFRGENFVDCPLHVPADPSMRKQFTEKKFVEGTNAAKFAKVFTRESFQLYSIT